jgi:hypothetical protein
MIHARKDYECIQESTGGNTLKIPYQEPVFLIRGQDKVGALTVKIWCILAWLVGAKWNIVSMAWRHANAMAKWPKKKLPDLKEYKMKIVLLVVSVLIASAASAQSGRLKPSNNQCADAFANGERASFQLKDQVPRNSRKYKYLLNQGFAFGATAETMYLGDKSQDSLCTLENLQKLETLNKVLDTPVLQTQSNENPDLDLAGKALKAGSKKYLDSLK